MYTITMLIARFIMGKKFPVSIETIASAIPM